MSETDGSPGDLYDQLDPVGQRLAMLDDSFTSPSRLDPGLYASEPHALLVGRNGRSMTLLDHSGCVEIAGVLVEAPDVLEQTADRLRLLADRLRQRQHADQRLHRENTGITDDWKEDQ